MRKQRKVSAILIISLMICIALSGCNEQQNTETNNNSNVGAVDTFSVDVTGGSFSVFNYDVRCDIDSSSVAEQVDITVTGIQNPVNDLSVFMLSCYEFGPDSQTFTKPIEISIRYNVDDIPSDVAESDIRVYVLADGAWELIEGSYADLTTHYSIARVSHFSQMACGGPAPESEDAGDDGTGDDDDDDNTSAQYWFKANLNFYSYKDIRLTESDHDDHYTVGVSAYWDPAPYVQYYQFKFEFHGNPPADYAWTCDHRDQGTSGCSPTHTSLYEGYVYQLGGDPNNEGYSGQYDGPNWAMIRKKNHTTGEMEDILLGQTRPDGTHGFGFLAVEDTVDDWEGLSDIAIGSLVNEMRIFLEEYVYGWEVWIRGVTERGD